MKNKINVIKIKYCHIFSSSNEVVEILLQNKIALKFFYI